ncbi:hypothetical protein GBF35_09240 [Nonomuraea phyllanthi]|uniref:hypothetical protein n=1 Tax=Nonomuraea phyllanthi TaxID=2219224 RepID=UPI0012933337|nr:hypothetical protein [Nonomuraea phyllanthi]QFY06853.1 hypothetical protein GBF35_09240 [Nonomuraea phyllanthi]
MTRTGTPGALVDSFGTGFLVTRVFRQGDDYLWVRTPGPRRGNRFTAIPEELRDPGLAAGGVALTPGTPVGDDRHYLVGARFSLALLMAAQPAGPHWTELAPLLRGVGELVRRVHDTVSPAPAAEPPRGTERLRRWMATGEGAAPAGDLHRLAVRKLGRERWDRVLGWCDGAVADGSRERVLLLGGVTLGGLVPARTAPPAGTPAAAGRLVTGEEPAAGGRLLVGEELAAGPPEYDLGWTLGELFEFGALHWKAADQGEPAAHCAAAARSLLDGYGREHLDLDLLGQVALLRVLTHAHDFAAYVAWTDQLHEYLDLAISMIDTDGTAALPHDTLA